MKTLYLGLISLVLVGGGCGDGAEGGGGDVGIVDAGATPELGSENSNTFFVDVEVGQDNPSVNGSISDPYRSVSFALENIGIQSFDLIVLPGMYDMTVEQFPIIINKSVNILGDVTGDETVGFEAAVFSGSGEYQVIETGLNLEVSFVIKDGGQLRNVGINGNRATGILLDGADTNSIVRNIEIGDCLNGIISIGESSTMISNSLVDGCSNVGIELRDGSVPQLAENVLKNNSVGLIIDDNSLPVFDRNMFVMNQLCDLVIRGRNNIDLVGNIWDDDVFFFSPSVSCELGENLVIQGVGNAVYQFIPFQLIPAFSGTDLIASIDPAFGEFIRSPEPTFAFSGTTNDLVALAIWDTPPIIDSQGVRNPQDILWFWHTGLDTGSISIVNYSDGGTPINGDLRNLASPISLQFGKTYYWAVWEWDQEGINIIRSSQVNYFIVSF